MKKEQMKHFLINLQLYSFCFISTLVYSQGISITGLDYKANLNSLNLHLAATKLCKDFYQNNDLVAEWANKSNYTLPNNRTSYGCHVCAESLGYPFLTPLESFVDRYLKDKRLMRNKTNAFTVKALKEEINAKYKEDYDELVENIDTENMVFYQYDLIQGYHMENRELSISMWNPDFNNKLPNSKFSSNPISMPLLKGHGIDENGQIVTSVGNYLGWFIVPMLASEAEKIYSNYAQHYHPNPPFAIATKLYYAIRMGKDLGGKPRHYQVVFKKVEFFLPSINDLKSIQTRILPEVYKSENKIAEVVFEEKIYNTKEGYPFQNVLSIK